MGCMAARTQPVDLGILLLLAYQEFVRQLGEAHEKAGFDDLGGSDGFVFRTLANGPLTVSDLAARLQISKQGAGQIVDDMQRRGYVESRPDPDDRRARLISLSPRGAQALAEARRFHRSYERRLVRQHGPEPVADLRRMLEAMAGGEEQTVNPRFRALYL
jgi:DNA-binding MarR family transcriptional regulator